MKRSRSAILAALAAVLALPACTDQQKQITCKVVGTIDHVIRPAMAIVIPVLAPKLAAEYSALQAAADAAKQPLLDACASGSTGPEVTTGIDAAMNLLTWWQAHKPDAALATRALEAKGMPVPRAIDDPVATLLRENGVEKPEELGEDLDLILADLHKARAKLAAKQASREGK